MKYIYTLLLVVFLASCTSGANEIIQEQTNGIIQEREYEIVNTDSSTQVEEVVIEEEVEEEKIEVIEATTVAPAEKSGGHSAGSSGY